MGAHSRASRHDRSQHGRLHAAHLERHLSLDYASRVEAARSRAAADDAHVISDGRLSVGRRAARSAAVHRESEIRTGESDQLPHFDHEQVLRRRLRGEGVTARVIPSERSESREPQRKNDNLLKYRDRFPILQKTKYLVSHSLGAMPDATREALEEYADAWATRGVRAWGDKWWMMSIEVGDIIAPLIGAPRGSVVMLPNVTTAEAVV